ncbi:MAG: hypothetical protein AAF889_06790 [Cyanobacteria bacterium P01_D01_bin.73]
MSNIFSRSRAFAIAAVFTTTFVPVISVYAEAPPPVQSAAHTEATLRRIIEMRFDAPPSEMLPQLLTRVDLYDSTVVEVRFDHSLSKTPGEMGVGSRRICMFADGRELVEPLLVYEPPYAYGYTVDSEASTLPLPVREIVLLYDFTETQTGGAKLTVRAFYDPRVPDTGAIIEPVLTGTLRRTFQTATNVFGGTYLGDHKP